MRKIAVICLIFLLFSCHRNKENISINIENKIDLNETEDSNNNRYITKDIPENLINYYLENFNRINRLRDYSFLSGNYHDINSEGTLLFINTFAGVIDISSKYRNNSNNESFWYVYRINNILIDDNSYIITILDYDEYSDDATVSFFERQINISIWDDNSYTISLISKDDSGYITYLSNQSISEYLTYINQKIFRKENSFDDFTPTHFINKGFFVHGPDLFIWVYGKESLDLDENSMELSTGTFVEVMEYGKKIDNTQFVKIKFIYNRKLITKWANLSDLEML